MKITIPAESTASPRELLIVLDADDMFTFFLFCIAGISIIGASVFAKRLLSRWCFKRPSTFKDDLKKKE
jgi:hypothetical protein